MSRRSGQGLGHCGLIHTGRRGLRCQEQQGRVPRKGQSAVGGFSVFRMQNSLALVKWQKEGQSGGYHRSPRQGRRKAWPRWEQRGAQRMDKPEAGPTGLRGDWRRGEGRAQDAACILNVSRTRSRCFHLHVLAQGFCTWCFLCTQHSPLRRLHFHLHLLTRPLIIPQNTASSLTQSLTLLPLPYSSSGHITTRHRLMCPWLSDSPGRM